ncbi:MAG: 1-acyl-sn-glycerol-3-phosphate acyltransferase [Myxococcales bacterium]|nr:1-acyl-sn-glycerol-3-phosphate acyltransferase [Myxococcales bacterium]
MEHVTTENLFEHAKLIAGSTVGWTASMGWMVLNSTLGAALAPVLPLRKRAYYLFQPAVGSCVRLMGSRVEAYYHPNFDATRASVFCQNHVSVIDGHVACATIPVRFCGLMNSWHFKVPGYGWIMRQVKGIGVAPKRADRTAFITAEAKKRADEGISILTFPEGHRTTDGTVRPFRRGAFFMARDAGLPVVPLAVRGLFEINRKGSMLFRRGGTVEVYLGEPIETAGLDDEQIAALAHRVHGIIADWVERGQLPEGTASIRPAVRPFYPLADLYWQGPNGS